MTEGIALFVLETFAFVLAVVQTLVCALSRSAGSIVAVSALALVVVSVRQEKAVGVPVAQGHFALGNLAPANR